MVIFHSYVSLPEGTYQEEAIFLSPLDPIGPLVQTPIPLAARPARSPESASPRPQSSSPLIEHLKVAQGRHIADMGDGAPMGTTHQNLKIKITLLRVIPTMTFIHFLTGKSSGILSDISSDILFGILSGISSGI